MCRSIMSLSKITCQMWEVVLLGVRVVGWEGWIKFGKGRVGNIGGGRMSLPTKTI